MRWRSSYLRAILGRRSTIVKAILFVAACMMFYAAYRLLSGVLKSKLSDDPLALDSHNDGEDHWWTGSDGNEQVYDHTYGDIGDLDLAMDELLPMVAQKKRVHPIFPSNWPQRRRDGNGLTISGETTKEDTDLAAEVKAAEREKETEEKRKSDRELAKEREEGWRKSFVPVVVVEEHHDVIPYWFRAVTRGLLPSHGNVLLHIDAHPDVSLPTINASFPLFRTPALSELVYLMQRNDMFVSGVALTGFFKRYIWVIPPWDKQTQEVMGFTGHSRFHVLAGLVQDPYSPQETGRQKAETYAQGPQQEKTAQAGPEVCYCVDMQGQMIGDVQESNQCFIHAGRSHNNPLGVRNRIIFREQCQAKVQAVAELVMEDKAIELLNFGPGRGTAVEDRSTLQPPFPDQSGVWLGKEESVILDIDEDYYGVEAAITPLQEASLDDSELNGISGLISKIFCAKNAKQEARADKVFTNLIDSLHQEFVLCQRDNCAEPSHSTLETYSTKFNQQLRKKSVAQTLCVSHAGEKNTLVAFLIRQLFFLTSYQLLALGQVGICLKESPRTMRFDPSRGMKVCTGYNRPGNSVVTFHVPDGAEIEERSRKLKMLLKSGEFTPRIVTVARSVRDGYTPRGKFDQIEGDVVDTLQAVYPREVTPRSLFYDSQLLAGRGGWPDRNRRSEALWPAWDEEVEEEEEEVVVEKVEEEKMEEVVE